MAVSTRVSLDRQQNKPVRAADLSRILELYRKVNKLKKEIDSLKTIRL
ncbi:MAG: hypothetical protein NTV30_04480 [Chloroflexi bacterium]|nr:hypothetical protein [Chloroflexota bacterium]